MSIEELFLNTETLLRAQPGAADAKHSNAERSRKQPDLLIDLKEDGGWNLEARAGIEPAHKGFAVFCMTRKSL
ncbi:MAG: hypothetical protein ACLGSH_10995 [Acidobacteriota bacterium]